MGCRIRVPRGHLAALVLSATVVISLLSTGPSFVPLGGSAYADVTLVRPADARGTVQLAQLEDQFETVARHVAPSVVAISASLNTVDSDDAVRADSLNGDKLEAL